MEPLLPDLLRRSIVPVTGIVGGIVLLAGGWEVASSHAGAPKTAEVAALGLALVGVAVTSTAFRRPAGGLAILGQVLTLIGIAALFGAPAPALVRLWLALAGTAVLIVVVAATLVRAEGRSTGGRTDRTA